MSDAADWLGLADNQRTWARLRDSLALADGFELLFAVVVDSRAGAYLQALLEARARELGRRFVRLDVRDGDVLAQLTGLGKDEALVVLDTTAASRRATVELERCLLELNPRRDWIAQTVPGPVVAVVRPDALRRFADLAPDLFSVHTASFRWFGGADLGLDERPEWLLADHEFVGLLGIDPSFGYADRSRVPKIVGEPPEPPEPLIGRDELLAELTARLVPGGERLVEVSGTPGVGRTALLAHAAQCVNSRWDHVIWLDCRHVWDTPVVDEVVDAVIQVLAPNEVPPFDINDARDRFVELTTLQAVLIIADDRGSPGFARPGARSCLITVTRLEPGTNSLAVLPLDQAALQDLIQAAQVPAEVLPSIPAALPGTVGLLGRWLRGQDGSASDSVGRLASRWSSTASTLSDLCHAIAEDAGWASVAALQKLLHLSPWLLEFRPGLGASEAAQAELERLGILIDTGSGYRLSETGIGRYGYLTEPPLSQDWRERLAAGANADRFFANLGSALWRHHDAGAVPWLSTLELERQDLERCAESVWPAMRAAVWLGAVDVQPMRTADERDHLRIALVAALRCGRAEQAREIRDQLGTYGVGEALLDMLAMLRPTEWDPHIELGRSFVSGYCLAADPEIAAALRRGFDIPVALSDDPLPDAPPARTALALRCEPCTPESLHALLAALDQTRELDRLAAHFIGSRLAWLHILANDWPAFERAFAEVERSARAWGISYALVRVRLLEFTALEVRGELDRAAAKLPSALAAVDRTYGTRSRVALTLLRRALRIYSELDRADDAEKASKLIRKRRRAV